MSDVRRHLSYYWYMYTALNAGCELLYQLWALTYIATHALVFHLWTREIKFNSITTCILSHFSKLYPLVFHLPHNRGYNNL